MNVEQIIESGANVPENLLNELREATKAYEIACDTKPKHRKETARWAAAREAVERWWNDLNPAPGIQGCPDPQTTESANQRGWDFYYRTR